MNTAEAETHDDRKRPRPSPNALLLVGAIATLARLAVILATADSALFADMVDYHDRANVLLKGGSLSDSYRGPGYPLLLALLYWLPGPEFMVARIGNAVLAGVTSIMAGLLAAEFVAPRAALGVALVTALYPASVLSAVYLMPEGLYTCLTLGAVLTARRLTPARAFAAGALAGASAVTRSLGAALPLALLLAHCPRRAQKGPWLKFLGLSALLAGACLLTLAPWLVHTTRVSGGLMLDSNSAFNLLLGANPRARERLEVVSYGQYWQSHVVGMPREAERNRRAIAESWQWIRENPGRWLRLIPEKAAYLYGLEGREHVWMYSHSYFGPRGTNTVRFWGVVLVAGFPPLAIAAAIGLFRPGLLATPAGIQIAALLALTTILHGVSFGETRFHLPLIPFLGILAARGVSALPPMTPLRWAAALALVGGLALGWWSHWPEIVDQFGTLTGPEGWNTKLPY